MTAAWHSAHYRRRGHIDDCDSSTLGDNVTYLFRSAEHDLSHKMLVLPQQSNTVGSVPSKQALV